MNTYPFAAQGLYNVVPRPLKHKHHGLIYPVDGQSFVRFYRPDGTLQRVEVHHNNNRVITYLAINLI